MSSPVPHSLARILAAPWQQRRSAGAPWGIAVVVALCFAAPVLLLGWSLFAASPQSAHALRSGAGNSAWIGLTALLVAGWMVFIGNVLQQNHPTLARLVPHHATQLRLALLVAWAFVSLAAAALPGFAFDAALAWGCCTAAGLALLAACLRWPLMWVLGLAAPFAMAWVTRHYSPADLFDALRQPWAAHRLLVTGIVAAAGVLVLVAVVGDGDARHAAAYAWGRRLRRTMAQGQPTDLPVPACWKRGLMGDLAVHGRPYARWMARLLARPDSPLMSRLLLGFGPSVHWSTRVFQAFWFFVVSFGVCLLVTLFIGTNLIVYALPWFAFGALTGLCSPALQAVPLLRQTQREQALLVLLPGVPRGARLNRWLAWQMSASFVLSALVALALAAALEWLADVLQPGASMRATAGMSDGVAAALLPQVAWQWRHWARLSGTSGSAAQLPTITPILLGLALMALHAVAGVGFLASGIVLALVALAYCAWRWARMGAEPTALPVGRLG